MLFVYIKSLVWCLVLLWLQVKHLRSIQTKDDDYYDKINIFLIVLNVKEYYIYVTGWTGKRSTHGTDKFV